MAIALCPLARSVATPSQPSESRCDPWQTHAIRDGSCRVCSLMASHNLSLTRVQMESMDEAVLTFSRISCAVDPVSARSLVGRHNSWLLLCSFSAQRYLGENWVVVGEWW